MGALEINNKKLRCTRCLDIRRLLIIPSTKNPKIEITCHCNKSVENLLDYCKEIKNVTEIKLVCSKCNKNSIVHPRICYDCLLIYCSKCCDNHLPNKNLDNVPLRASLVGHNTIHVEKSDYYCVDHQNYNFIGYCQQCLMNLCNECIREGTHKIHHVDIFSVIKPSRKEKEEFKNNIKISEQKIESNNKKITNFCKLHQYDKRTKKIEKKYQLISEENSDILMLLKFCFDLYKSNKMKNYSIIYNIIKNKKFNTKLLDLDKSDSEEEKFEIILKYLKNDALILYKRCKNDKEKFLSDNEEDEENEDEEEEIEEENEEVKEDNDEEVEDNENKEEDNEDEENKEENEVEENKEDNEESYHDDNDENKNSFSNNQEIIENSYNQDNNEENEDKNSLDENINIEKEENIIDNNLNINAQKNIKNENKIQNENNFHPKKLKIPSIFDQKNQPKKPYLTSKDIQRPKKLKIPSMFEKREENNKPKERANIINTGANKNMGLKKDFLSKMMEKRKVMGMENIEKNNNIINKEEMQVNYHTEERNEIIQDNNEGNTEEVINKVIMTNKKKKKPKRSEAFGFGQEFIELPKHKQKLEVVDENNELNENQENDENQENIENIENNDENNENKEENENEENKENNENNSIYSNKSEEINKEEINISEEKHNSDLNEEDYYQKEEGEEEKEEENEEEKEEDKKEEIEEKEEEKEEENEEEEQW